MTKNRQDIETELNSNIPREVVEQRQAGGGRSLSYLPTWYVIDRLNRVFGSLGWDSETRDMRLVSDNPARYVATVRITVSVPEINTDGTMAGFRSVFKDGTGWGADKPRKDGSVESPHEMAAKEAESDALKRAAMKLGISMGLGLYDKSGEFIEETKAPTAQVIPEVQEPKKDSSVLIKKIKATARVLNDRGIQSMEDTKSFLKQNFGVDKSDDLNNTQVIEVLNILEGKLK